MQHSIDLHSTILVPVENDTPHKPFCGPTAIATVTGQPLSSVLEACRRAAHGDDWPNHHLRSPKVRGLVPAHLETALKLFGVVGYWKAVRDRPTLAAWLEGRTQDEFRSVAVVVVTGHYVTVSGEQFVDTFTGGQVVHVDEAPRRRMRVKYVFIVTGRVAASPVTPQVAAKPKPKRKAVSGYAAFAKFARSVGATWRKDRDYDELEMSLPDGRKLSCTHSISDWDWDNAQRHLEEFLSSAEPDPDYFEMVDDDGKEWWTLYV